MASLRLPGANARAYLMFPLRLLVVGIIMSLFYPFYLIKGLVRAISIRLTVGRPSQALKLGTRGNIHKPGTHYTSQHIYDQPLDKSKLHAALVGLCAEDGIAEELIDLQFMDEEPKIWPIATGESGSFKIDYFLDCLQGSNFIRYWEQPHLQDKQAVMKMHVFNGKPGNPTVVLYAGSGNAWDGSANYNFVKELNSRYLGNAPNKVFQKPEISFESAKRVDRAWFLCFLLRMFYTVGRNCWGMAWPGIRAMGWAGGNGLGPEVAAMNFNKEDSARLYAAAKAQGITPFACFTFACVKACREVLHQGPVCIVQQASLQTRHYPVSDQGDTRDFVGDWLVGAVEKVPRKYGLQEAQAAYKKLQLELQEIGPSTLKAFMAKAYGIRNSGAAGFQLEKTYNDNAHIMDKCLFMNNYGVRTMPAGSAFHTWNWNAPFWLGFNTINVNGRNQTMIGSWMWGLEVVEALRDNIEATLRDIISQAPAGSSLEVPKYISPKGFGDSKAKETSKDARVHPE